jgi:hypothetical protein
LLDLPFDLIFVHAECPQDVINEICAVVTAIVASP